MAMLFNTTFKNILVISWWLVLLVEETGVPVKKHFPATSHNVVSCTSLHESDMNT